MTQKTFERLCLLLAPMPASCPWVEGSEVAYEVGLDDVDDADVMRAVKACLRTSKFRPTVAEIIEHIGPGPVDVDELHGTIVALVRKYGLYGKKTAWGFGPGDPPYPSDDVRQVVLNLGGWDTICMWDSGDASLRNAIADAAKGINRRAKESVADNGQRRVRGDSGLRAIGAE
jgi:hypothetical protein